jgi:hypothetical protein
VSVKSAPRGADLDFIDRIMSRHSLYSHGKLRHCDPESSAVNTGREEGVVSPIVSAGRGKGTGAAASAADARVGVQVGPYCAFADVSAAAPAIADTARRSRFITASFFTQSVNAHRRKAVLVYYRNLRFPELCGNR